MSGPCICNHSHGKHRAWDRTGTGACTTQDCTCQRYKAKQYPPPKGKVDVGNIRMPIALRDRLDAIAQREERSRNAVIVFLLRKILGMKKEKNL